MKKALVITALTGLLLTGCEEELPQPVTLISPEDGATFTEQPPTFVWSSDPSATSYVLRVVDNDFETGSVIIHDTLDDTTYTLTEDIFTQIDQAEYEWAVAPLPVEEELVWGEVWSFSIDKSLPEPGDILISPEDGTVFTSDPPIFRWKSFESATSYVIRIVKDAFFTGDIIIEDTLGDTTYTMSQEDFELALNGDYIWSVAPVVQGGVTWRQFRNMTFDKPLLSLDLDTTYFPYGLNNQWVYERHVWGYEFTSVDPGWNWDYYDTVSISVNDSLFGINGWTFHLNIGFRDGSLRYSSNEGDTVMIVGDWLIVFDEYKIHLEPEETDTLGYEDGVEVIYKQDTLCLTKKRSDFEEPISFWNWRWTTSRIKGIGVIRQFYEDSYSGHGCGDEQNIEDSLLYFIKGQDTVWRKEDL